MKNSFVMRHAFIFAHFRGCCWTGEGRRASGRLKLKRKIASTPWHLDDILLIAQLKGVSSDRWAQTHVFSRTHTRRLRKWGCNGVTFALFAEVNNSSPRKWEIATNFDGVAELCMALQRQTNSRVTRERNLWTDLCCFERWINHFSMSFVYFWNRLNPEFVRSTCNSND
jgi:hypothetical protein